MCRAFVSLTLILIHLFDRSKFGLTNVGDAAVCECAEAFFEVT